MQPTKQSSNVVFVQDTLWSKDCLLKKGSYE
jgi:hypothetical protein